MTTSVPLVDLKAQYASIKPEMDAAIQRVLSHCGFIMGPEVKAFEEAFAVYCGTEQAVGVASGTAALHLSLLACSLGPGDEVITTPFTFFASGEAISQTGARPVFVDIDPFTYNIDPAQIEAAITPRTKAIMPVHLYGQPAEMDIILDVAHRHDLLVIEDAAQAHGAEYRGRRAGSAGDLACFSFYPSKNLGCYGDGGAVFTDDDTIADTLRSIRVHGKGSHKYDNARIGLNARLDTLQAAILNAKFDIFPEEIDLRNQIASKYTKLLSALNLQLSTPHVPSGLRSAWAQYSLLSDKKDQIQSALKEKGIPTAAYYPKPLHLQTAFAYLRYKEGDMPASEDCSRQIFSLPMHPYLEDREIERICGIIRREISCRDTRRREGKGSQTNQIVLDTTI